MKNQYTSSHQLILIDRQKTQLNDIQPTVFTKPLIFLESESNTNLMPEWLAEGYHLRLYYHQINPIVLEHCLQLALYKEHQQSQIKALYEQVKVQLEKEVRLTRKIIGDINQYLLNPLDEKHIFSQVQSSLTPYNDSTTVVAPVGIMRSNLAGDYLYGNQMFFELFDLTEEEQLEGEWLSKIHSTDREPIKKTWLLAHERRSLVVLKFRVTREGGSIAWLYGQLSFEVDATGEPIGSMATFSEITVHQESNQRLRRCIQTKQEVANSVRAANQQLNQLVSQDRVTQLANRFCFEGVFFHEWQRAEAKQLPLSIIILDVDEFRNYNGIYGYQQGDICLQTVAKILKQFLKRPRDLLARYGSDEFAILLPDTPLEGAKFVAHQIQKAMQSLAKPTPPPLPLTVPNKVIRRNEINLCQITLSLGLTSLIPTASLSNKDFIDLAQTALLMAKQQGGNQLAIKTVESSQPLNEEENIAIHWDNF